MLNTSSNKNYSEVQTCYPWGNYLANYGIINSVRYVRPIICCQLTGPSSTDMFYCLTASYHYVIEQLNILSNLKRTAVTLYVVSSPDKLTTMRMLYRKVQPLKHIRYVLDGT